MGPTFKKNNKIKIKSLVRRTAKRETELKRDFYFLFFFSRFSLRYMKIGLSEFVGARRKVFYSTRATRRNQKHGISPSF